MTIDVLSPTPPIPGVVDQLDFSELTSAQQRYLSRLPLTGEPARACRDANIAYGSVRNWRARSPQFKSLETAIRSHATNHAVTLATNIAKTYAPLTMQTIVDRAITKPTTDRQAVTSQKAAETVLKVAGVLQEGSGLTNDVERVDILAMRLWKRGSQPPDDIQAPPPIALRGP